MKVRIAVALIIALLMLGSTYFVQVKASPTPPAGFLYESGAFGINGGEFAAAKLVNVDTSASHNFRVVIYRASGAALLVVLDTGVQTLAAESLGGGSSPVEPGALDDYSVEITTDSDKLIPAVSAQTPGCDPTCHIQRVELHGAQLTSFKQAF